MLSEKISLSLNRVYQTDIDAQDSCQQLVNFRWTTSKVRQALQNAGIETQLIGIEVKSEKPAYKSHQGYGGTVTPGTRVLITQGNRVLFNQFFESPDEEYQY